MNRHEPLAEQAETVRLGDFGGGLRVGSLGEMNAERRVPGRAIARPTGRQVRLEAQGVGDPEAGDSHGEAVGEDRLPRIVVHHRRHSGNEVLQRPEKQRVPTGNHGPPRDRLTTPGVKILAPPVSVGVRWGA